MSTLHASGITKLPLPFESPSKLKPLLLVFAAATTLITAFWCFASTYRYFDTCL